MRNGLIALSVSLLIAPAFGGGVKYRGIFVNDEDWSLRPWAVKHFGAEEQIGVRAYEKIFALMKRSGLNLLWPAMHEGGYEFSARPENLTLADKFGIRIGTSHCEPMLRNNCYLPKADQVKWSWTNHPDFMKDYWSEGVRRGEGHDILWTIGLRGIHDGKMKEGKTTQEKIRILEDVFACQKSLLPTDAPTLFVPYKEVLPLYNAGLQVPSGTTIMWTNDNFGYIRRLGGPQSQGHGGGIYWHLSYHGSPHGYIHLCTTPPGFMWYELVAKCWNNGVRDVWMVNAGDVFQAEVLLDAYGRFAADPDAWGPDAQHKVLAGFVDATFRDNENKRYTPAHRSRIVNHLEEYYNLGFNRKPEHICVQWTTNLPASVKSDLLRRYHALLEEDLALDADSDDTYFRLIGFQARFLACAGIIHLEGRDKASAQNMLKPLHDRWNKLDGGSWSGFWCDTIDENGGRRQPTKHNRWSSQMQWPWNEPSDPMAKNRGVSRADYPATAYRANVPEPRWLTPQMRVSGTENGAWKEVGGLGTSGKALALLPVKPGVGVGAKVVYEIGDDTSSEDTSSRTLVLQFLPDFALHPGLKLDVKIVFDDGTEHLVEVPKSHANIGEHDRVRNAAVQDNFIRVEVAIPAAARKFSLIATSPGVVIDRVGIRAQSRVSG